MSNELIICLTCYGGNNDLMFKSFILSGLDEPSLTMYSARYDLDEENPEIFAFRTDRECLTEPSYYNTGGEREVPSRNRRFLTMVEYYLNRFFWDYDEKDCTWEFSVYSISVDQTYSDYNKLNDLVWCKSPIFDYEFKLQDVVMHISKCLEFMQAVSVLPATCGDDLEDLPDLIPLDLDSGDEYEDQDQDTEEEEGEAEVEIEKIYDSTTEDLVFVAN